MNDDKIKFVYLIFSTIVLALALAYNQYELAFAVAFMGFLVASS